jgi:hypothetical protein
LDADLSHFIAEAQFLPPFWRRDQARELVPDIAEEDISWVVQTHGLPTHESKILIETCRQLRTYKAREFTRTSADAEPILAGSVNINLNAYVARHVLYLTPWGHLFI